MFELCAPTIELGGQNGVFLASMLPVCADFVPGAKVACIAVVYNVGCHSFLAMCAATMVAVIREGGSMPSRSNLCIKLVIQVVCTSLCAVISLVCLPC